VFVLEEEAAFILFGVTKVSNLIVFGEYNTTTEWIGLILDNDMEPLDALINILALIFWIRQT
jgi:hypothetical protein